MNRRLGGVWVVFRRELATVRRTPGYAVLAVGLLVVLGGLVAVGGGGATGFVPAVVDLLLPTEVLVPLLAVVLGYRALFADAASGELGVIRTYPVSAAGYVVGVLLARTAALVVLVGGPFALVGAYVWLTAAPDTGIFATHSGVDSPVLFLRFLALVVPFGAAYLSLSAAVSTIATTRRSAFALGLLALLAGVLGGDLAVLRSLSAGASPSGIAGSLALSPNGAFRGLVFEHVIGVSFAPEGGFVDTGRAVASLVGWTVVGGVAAVAAIALGPRVGVAVEHLRARLDR
ncbi:ABC-type transport system involved in multi-copper enzyme maturation, permease component [Halorubrum ezzemoulense]|uniref:ABC-type transport system involved in multi-copper enzyme maturation, permease component n=1 Tax=Halorubrum ezzemoulense TaxID=337243 RepID=A0A238XTL9_HALEZ|nr:MULTISPECIES: ABC transporter permease subunit [Halorubrum]MDB2261649.1 copper ABC transporter permease [Halorubrum ezzemoulense]MDB2267780.1 copper ABC transporter permease [Halorubrum ezzemoulense]MDB9280615.1 copper ABC transporter permease [Halorubrum ezzemoulense]MDB9284206.1 copper ABC transporter permease [Halorubrum ezzemoulense]TKX36921.1 copper ABC transporter permease [Halorubrum sp. CGM4_25_10-8A]